MQMHGVTPPYVLAPAVPITVRGRTLMLSVSGGGIGLEAVTRSRLQPVAIPAGYAAGPKMRKGLLLPDLPLRVVRRVPFYFRRPPFWGGRALAGRWCNKGPTGSFRYVTLPQDN